MGNAMGRICSGGTETDHSATSGGVVFGFPGKLTKEESKLKGVSSISSESDSSDSDASPRQINFTAPSKSDLKSNSEPNLSDSDGILKPKSKVTRKTSFLQKYGTANLEKATQVLGSIGTSVSNLNAISGFIPDTVFRGNEISILAFEVANTIIRGANLFQSLSEDRIHCLKEKILQSQGVRLLISTNMEELLSIAAADKRQEFDIFSREVIRFGVLCKDPRLHNLHRSFSRVDSEDSSLKQRISAEAITTMEELTKLAQNTSELYYELHALDRFEQDYRRKLEEVESSNLAGSGESLTIFHYELNLQRKIVKGLQKKSLWSKNMEEIVQKLVNTVTYIDEAILEAFGHNGKKTPVNEETEKRHMQRLGIAGLALHYANTINMINTIASRPASLPSSLRDSLYRALPMSVKTALRSRLQNLKAMEELSISRVKAEMDETLLWLVPVAINTMKAHQAFGWIGEWANSSNAHGKSNSSHDNPIRLQTLYHADKQKTEVYILELITWLHCLIGLVRHRNQNVKPSGSHSPIPGKLVSYPKTRKLASSSHGITIQTVQISPKVEVDTGGG